MGWWALYAVATALSSAFVGAAFRHEHPTWTSVPTGALVLLCTFVASNASQVFIVHEHMQFYPAIDIACAVFFFAQWRETRAQWSLALVTMFGVEIAEHALYFSSSDHGYSARYAYDLFLNVCYLLQLSCVVAPAFVAILSRKGETHPP